MTRFRIPIASMVAAFLLTVTAHSLTKIDEATYKSDVQKWRADRLARLKREDGWLSLVGLFWLKAGENRFGSDRSNSIVLPKGPKFAGSLFLENQTVRLEANPEATITENEKPVQKLMLNTDKGGKPTILSMGSLIFHVIQRGPKMALRVKDKENPVLATFPGVESFPVNINWRIEAKFEPYDPPKKIPILNIIGMVEDAPSPGALLFEAAGKQYRLDAIAEEGSDDLFIIFADATTGRETYGAGRYLDANPPADGKVILDFNKAYNPPCAFTAFATCPLPPRQNRLTLRVEAGEKKYSAPLH